MKLRPLGLCLLILLALWIPRLTYAQISSSDARRLGMETAWQAQMQLPRAGVGLVSSHLWADPNRLTTYAVVEFSDRTIRISAERPDKHGQPIGIEEAKKLASAEAARLLGKPDGFQVVEVTVPAIKLVLISSEGVVQTFDAETGELLWLTACGPSYAPAHPAAVSAVGISLIHGEELYLLDWTSGKHLMSKRLRNATSNAVAVCQDIGFLSDFTGRVEAYGLGRKIPPWSIVMRGRAIGAPVTLGDGSFTAIATDTGFVYVCTVRETPQVWIRYQATADISGSLAASQDAFYAGTIAGNLAKISVADRLGQVLWEFRAGQAITRPALIIGNQVIVATEAGDLLAIDDGTGLSNWERFGARVTSPLAQAANKLFYRTTSNEIAVVDASSGQAIGQTSVLSLSQPVLNQLSDRLYLVGADGRVQCLRPQGAVLPTLHKPAVASETEEESAPAAEATEAAPSTNPFGGMGTEPAVGAGDPFGDPFGGAGAGNAGATTDPFGGNDPFGGKDPFGGDK